MSFALDSDYHAGGRRETCNTYISVMSAYARPAKNQGYDLQAAINQIPSGDIFILLGDFNACVGKRDAEDDIWKRLGGKHGLGSCNEAGEKSLEFSVPLIISQSRTPGLRRIWNIR